MRFLDFNAWILFLTRIKVNFSLRKVFFLKNILWRFCSFQRFKESSNVRGHNVVILKLTTYMLKSAYSNWLWRQQVSLILIHYPSHLSLSFHFNLNKLYAPQRLRSKKRNEKCIQVNTHLQILKNV